MISWMSSLVLNIFILVWFGLKVSPETCWASRPNYFNFNFIWGIKSFWRQSPISCKDMVCRGWPTFKSPPVPCPEVLLKFWLQLDWPLRHLDKPFIVHMGQAVLALLLVQQQLLLILLGVFYVLHLPLCLVPGLVLHQLPDDILQFPGNVFRQHRGVTDGSVIASSPSPSPPGEGSCPTTNPA